MAMTERSRHRSLNFNFIQMGWVLLVIFSVVSLMVGVSDLSIHALFAGQPQAMQTFWISRVPRLVTIILAGAGTGVAGLLMQQLSQNAFVSPASAATADAAKLGLLVSALFFAGASSFSKMLVAFVFALAGTGLFMMMLSRVQVKNPVVIPLMGMMLGSVIDAVTTAIAYRFELVQSLSIWMQGDFSMIIKGRFELILLAAPVLILIYYLSERFTAAGLGEDIALSLGIPYKRLIQIGMALVALLTACILVIVGDIPFVGLIVPNLITLTHGSHMKATTQPTAIYSAVFLLICDLISRLVIFPYEVGISLVAGVIGSLIFIVILGRELRQ